MSEFHKLTLVETAAKLQKKEVTATEMVEASLAQIAATEPQINACLSVLGDQARQKAKEMDAKGVDPSQALWGVPLTLKDLFCLKGSPTTAASKILENFVPAYDASVTRKLQEAGAIIVAKTNLDEFGMGSATEFSAFGPTRNPWNQGKVPGGSSGGAAASVASYQTSGAFGTDTGGSIRQPAALCGCVGLKPSYGRISRFGIIAFASSLDQAGPMARRVADCAHLLAATAGADPQDSTSSNRPVEDYVAATKAPPKLRGLKLGLPKELFDAEFQPEAQKHIEKTLEKLKDAGVELVSVSLPNLSFAVASYYLIASAEASTNLARYDGVRYGRRAENPKDLTDLYRSSRSQFLGPEVKRRIILGTFALSSGYYDAYFRKAAQVRRLIREDYYQALTKCDFLFSPVTTLPAWDLGSFAADPLAAYQLDLMTLPVNLAGLPALSLPVGLGGESNLPFGMQLIGRPFDECGLLGAGQALEELFPPLL